MMANIWWSLPLTLVVFFAARKLAVRFKMPLLNPLLVAMVVMYRAAGTTDIEQLLAFNFSSEPLHFLGWTIFGGMQTLLFLAFFTFLAWLMKREYWKDVH